MVTREVLMSELQKRGFKVIWKDVGEIIMKRDNDSLVVRLSKYELCENVQEALKMIVLDSLTDSKNEKSSGLLYSEHKIIYELVNNQDASILSRPHRKVWGGLTMVYSIIAALSDSTGFQIPVGYGLADSLQLSEEKLYEQAVKETPLLFPPLVMTTAELARSLDIAEYSVCDDRDSIIISNNYLTNGAGAILYPGLLEQIADEVEADLIIFPSSVNEMVAVPAVDRFSVSRVKQLLQAGNASLPPEQKLSDAVYYYSRSTNTVREVN